MSRVSRLQYVNKDFSLRNREATAQKITILALRDSVSSLKKCEISDKVNLVHVKNNVRKLYPEFTAEDLNLAQDNISDWFRKNRHLSMFDQYRSRFPNIFEDAPFKETETFFDTVETFSEPEDMPMELSVIDEVNAVRAYREMGVSSLKTPNGWEIQF